MKLITIILASLTLISCGNSPFEQENEVTRRKAYRSALTADDKDEILQRSYRTVLVCDVYNKSEFVYFENRNGTYSAFVSDGANVEELSLYDEEDDYALENDFALYFEENGLQYLESADYIEVNGESHKLQIVDRNPNLREINRVKVNDDYSVTVLENLYQLVNCQKPVKKEK